MLEMPSSCQFYPKSFLRKPIYYINMHVVCITRWKWLWLIVVFVFFVLDLMLISLEFILRITISRCTRVIFFIAVLFHIYSQMFDLISSPLMLRKGMCNFYRKNTYRWNSWIIWNNLFPLIFTLNVVWEI